MKLKLIIRLALFLFAVQVIEAQESEKQTLIGSVRDAYKKPVEGAYVFLDTIKSDVVTNARGYFQIDVPKGVKKIYILSEEYGVLGAHYSGEKTLNFMYLNNNKTKDLENELIDMGYGKVLKKTSTSNLSKIEYGDEYGSTTFANIYEMIRARVPGVTVLGNNRIIIRGVKTISSGTDPLFIVEGSQVNNINDIPPTSVKSISVLKDASAAIYGVQGANGVLLIDLK